MRLNRLLGLATACLLASLALPSPAEEASENDGDTRVYLEAYGFFPLETHSKTTLDNNTTKETALDSIPRGETVTTRELLEAEMVPKCNLLCIPCHLSRKPSGRARDDPSV